MEEEKLISAAQDFLRLNRDYADTQANFDLMRAVIEREKLDPSSVSHLNRAWSRVKVITRNDPPIDQTPATVRPRETTVVPVPVAPEPEPPIDETQVALDAAAKELISNYGGTGGFKTFFNNLTAKAMELEMRDFRFQRAVEICFPQTETSLLTRGDMVLEEGRRINASRNGITLDYDAVQAVEAARRATAVGYANVNAGPAPLPRGASRSIVNLHQAVYIPKPLPSMKAVLDAEHKDHGQSKKATVRRRAPSAYQHTGGESEPRKTAFINSDDGI